MEKLKAWYVRYPAVFVVGYVAGHAYGPQEWLPAWVIKLVMVFHGV